MVALPQHEFRLDIAECSVTNLLDRYDELLVTSPAYDGQIDARLAE